MNRKFVIKEHYIFSKVFKKGRYAANQFLVIYALTNYNKKSATKLGISVSAKNGGAVCRNRAKRVIREAYRRLYDRIPPGYLIVVVGRQPCFNRKNKMNEVYKSMLSALRRLNLFAET